MFNFLLPSGRKINTDELVEALAGTEGIQGFLDAQSGQIEWLPDSDFTYGDSDDEKLAAIRQKIDDDLDQRYFRIETVPVWQQYQWMKSFADDIVSGENSGLAERIDIALDGSGAFGRFKRVLGEAGEEWLPAWYSYRDDCLWEEMQNWLASLPFPVRRQMDYADNCPVCQSMKRAESEGRSLSEKELKAAFGKARHTHSISKPKGQKDRRTKKS